jgi:hypothetical protein
MISVLLDIRLRMPRECAFRQRRLPGYKRGSTAEQGLDALSCAPNPPYGVNRPSSARA